MGIDCTEFIHWLMEEVMDEEMWELNAGANGEIICRKLKKLGLLETKDGYYIRHIENNAKESDLVYRPSAKAEWIPVSDRLPSEDECEWYLVTVKGHELFVDVAPFNYELWEGLDSHQKVIAWMPLPKPYKGGEE